MGEGLTKAWYLSLSVVSLVLVYHALGYALSQY